MEIKKEELKEFIQDVDDSISTILARDRVKKVAEEYFEREKKNNEMGLKNMRARLKK